MADNTSVLLPDASACGLGGCGAAGGLTGFVGGLIVANTADTIYHSLGGGKTSVDNMALQVFARTVVWGFIGLFVALAPGILMLNVKKVDLDNIVGKLPALEHPTISPLSNGEWLALNTIVDEHTVRELIPELKRCGACGIVEYPLNKIVE